ncbi:MAG TPA: transglutaminase domain-containing protein [Gemmataceae bacterium]|nr:transglutaminase domain-containing protein [Gemmataceae bacterium]
MRLHRLAVVVFVLGVAYQNVAGDQTALAPADGCRVSFTVTYRITGRQGTEKAVLTAPVPKSIDGRQKIVSVKYSTKPEREWEEKGVKYVRFVLNKPTGLQVVTLDVEAELYRYDLEVAGRRRRGELENRDQLKTWLKSEKFVEVDAKEIQQAAKSIFGADEIDTIRNIMAFVHAKVRYTGYDADDHGALWALQNGRGDCTEFCDLLVALCRAKNIPARIWDGYSVDDIAKGDTVKHSRVEVYTRKYGWVPFDPLHVARKHATFETLKPVYVYIDNQRSDAVLQNYHYSAYRYFGAPIQFDSEFAVTTRRELKQR